MSFEFAPTGNCESVILLPGHYVLEVWGAQGGTCGNISSGRGGYSQGVYHASTRLKLTICVGTSGKCSASETVSGGFNGGGNSMKSPQNLSYNGCSGGGATDIRTGDSLDDRIIVAGGGGGANSYSAVNNGGFGGGSSGGTGYKHKYSGTGATSTEGGKGGYYPGNSVYSPCSGQNGIFGFGGNGSVTAQASAGGGGGGYYGGGGGADFGTGGGGSGYIADFLTRKRLLAGDSEFLSPNHEFEKGHIGDGYARISPLCVTTKNMHFNRFFFSLFFFALIISY